MHISSLSDQPVGSCRPDPDCDEDATDEIREQTHVRDLPGDLQRHAATAQESVRYRREGEEAGREEGAGKSEEMTRAHRFAHSSVGVHPASARAARSPYPASR